MQSTIQIQDMHCILYWQGGQPTTNTLVPDDKSIVDIDTVTMRANIKDSKYNLSSDDQIKYGRAMQILTLWIISMWWKGLVECTGWRAWKAVKKYASNGILEVAELDKFSGPVCNWSSSSCKRSWDKPKKLAALINDDPEQDLFTESEKWHMAALGVDLVTPLLGWTKVITGASGGAGFMAGLLKLLV
jgi:hypothetical protein